MGTAFLHGNGGGVGLNLKVVGGTTQPTSARTNTIWACTGAKITGWYFSPTEPESPVNGVLWFGIGDNSKVAFNALKKNGIVVCPVSAKQYNNGAWFSLDAYIYQNSAWVQFAADWDGSLFDAGNQYEDITGGWTNTTGTAIEATVYSQTSFSTPNSTQKAIDLTGWNKLCVEYESVTKSAYFGISKIADLKVYKDFEASKQVTAAGTYELDISALSGEYYIHMVAGAANNVTCAFKAPRVRLE